MEYRPECSRCHASVLPSSSAYICANECTFCPTCYRKLRFECSNCSGELVRRPKPGRFSSGNPPAVTKPDPRVIVRPGTPQDLPALSELFDAYRQFYEQPPDRDGSLRFLSERVARGESTIFVAVAGGSLVGFTQLYPLFSSVSAGRMYLLNDLFVVPGQRRSGVGRLLMEAARSFAEREGAHSLALSTAVDNPAQRLYESLGWVQDREFLYYELPLPGRPAHG
jgi:hypothetical protein